MRQKVLYGLSRRPHEHVYRSLRCNQGARLDGKRARAVVTAGHLVRTQHGVTASAGQRRGDVEVRSYLRDQAGSRSLVFDLSIAHDRFGSSSHVQQNWSLSHPQDFDCLMRVAAHRETNAYKQTYADNQNISFLPAIMSTSNTASVCVFFSYRPTGRPKRTSDGDCRWNAITSQSMGIILVQSLSILPRPEEQSRTYGCQSGRVEDQPQCPGL